MGRPEIVHRTYISRFRDLCGPSGLNGNTIGFPNFCWFFETIHDPLTTLPCPLLPNVNRWATLKTSTEPTFPVFVTCVGPVGRMDIPLNFPIFCWFFETIDDPLSALLCPLMPNVNSWDALGASREPTFLLNATCVGRMGRLGITLASPIFFGFFEAIHDPLSALPCPLGRNVNRWAALKTSTEPTFPVFVTCVGQVGRKGIPLAFQNFCRFFQSIYDSLSALPCPLGPNVNRWAALKTSTEPTFAVFVTCVGPVARMGIPLAFPIFCWFFETIHDPLSALQCPLGPNVNSWDAMGASREPTFLLNATCEGRMGRLGITLASPIFFGFFEAIHDPLSALPCPLGRNVNRWAALKTSTEPTFPVFVTCVGPVDRMGIPLASPIFCWFFETIHDPLSRIPCPLGPNVKRWAALKTSTEPRFPVFVTCVFLVARMGITLASPNFCGFFETIHDPLSALLCPLGSNVNRCPALKMSTEPTFSILVTCVGLVGRMGIPLASPIFCWYFETIHDPLSTLPCPRGPNVNRWAALKTSTEPTLPVFMTFVGPVGRMGIPFCSPIFGWFFETIYDPLSAILCHLGKNVNSWDALGASSEPTFPFFVTCVFQVGRMGIPLAFQNFCRFF